MGRATEESVMDQDLYEFLSPEVREFLERSREQLDAAAQLRATAWKVEDPIREWEIRTRAEQPKGRRWRTLLGEGCQLVAEASRLHQSIHERERDALPHLKAAVVKLRLLRSGPEKDISPRTIERLEELLRLRTQAVEKLDELLRLSEGIVSARSRASSEEVAAWLEMRRRLLGESNTAKAGADAAERATLSREPARDRTADSGLEAAAERAMHRENAAPRSEPRSREGLRDEEWEAWLRSVEAEHLTDVVHPDRPTTAEHDQAQEEWDAAVRLASASSPAPSAPEAVENEDPDEEIEEPDMSDSPTPSRNKSRGTLLDRIELLADELRSVQEEAEHERAEAVAHLNGEIERLKKAHAAAMTAEVDARRSLEDDLEKARATVSTLESDLEMARKELLAAREEIGAAGKARKEMQAASVALAGEATAIRQERDALRGERDGLAGRLSAAEKDAETTREALTKHLAEARAGNARLAERVAELEAAGKELRDAFAQKELALEKSRKEEVARLELELAEARQKGDDALATVARERDEALALVTSLTRRMQMAGLAGGDPEEALPLTEELKRIRKALWCSEGELQSLRNLFLAFKEEVGDQLRDRADNRSRLGAELIDS